MDDVLEKIVEVADVGASFCDEEICPGNGIADDEARFPMGAACDVSIAVYFDRRDGFMLENPDTVFDATGKTFLWGRIVLVCF